MGSSLICSPIGSPIRRPERSHIKRPGVTGHLRRPVVELLARDRGTNELVLNKTGGDLVSLDHNDRIYTQDQATRMWHDADSDPSPVWSGARIVENMLDSQTPGTITNCTVTDIGDGVLRVESLANGGAVRWTSTFTTNGFFAYCGSLEMRTVNWEGGTIRLDVCDAGFQNVWQHSSPEWKRLAHSAVNTINSRRHFDLLFGWAGTIVEVRNVMLERRPQEIGAFVPGEFSGHGDERRFFATENGNSFGADGLVVEAMGDLIDPPPVFQYQKATQNARLYSNGLHYTSYWAQTNISVVLGANDYREWPGYAYTLTATAANATLIAINPTTAASGTHTSRFLLKRKTGTGPIEVTLDGGATWNAVTVADTFEWCAVDQSGLTNITPGIRIVTSGDEIYCSNIEDHADTTADELAHTGPISASAGVATKDETALTLDSAALSSTDGPIYFAIDNTGADLTVIKNNGADVLYIESDGGSGKQITLTDGTNTASKALADGINEIGLAYDATQGLMAVCVNGSWSANATYNGSLFPAASEHISNPNFDTDTIWTKGTGWVIADGKATKTGGYELLEQAYIDLAAPIVEGELYKVTFEIVDGGETPYSEGFTTMDIGIGNSYWSYTGTVTNGVHERIIRAGDVVSHGIKILVISAALDGGGFTSFSVKPVPRISGPIRDFARYASEDLAVQKSIIDDRMA